MFSFVCRACGQLFINFLYARRTKWFITFVRCSAKICNFLQEMKIKSLCVAPRRRRRLQKISNNIFTHVIEYIRWLFIEVRVCVCVGARWFSFNLLAREAPATSFIILFELIKKITTTGAFFLSFGFPKIFYHQHHHHHHRWWL